MKQIRRYDTNPAMNLYSIRVNCWYFLLEKIKYFFEFLSFRGSLHIGHWTSIGHWLHCPMDFIMKAILVLQKKEYKISWCVYTWHMWDIWIWQIQFISETHCSEASWINEDYLCIYLFIKWMRYSLKDREIKHRVQQARVLFLTSQSETHHEHTSYNKSYNLWKARVWLWCKAISIQCAVDHKNSRTFYLAVFEKW